MLRYCLRFSNFNTSNYVIKSKQFLIPAPPKRPANSFALYVKDKAAGKKVAVAKDSKAWAKDWNKFEEVRKPYEGITAKAKEEYTKIKK